MQKITDLPKLPERRSDSHKTMFGKILVIAGSVGMAGAASLVGKSALRSGAGAVTIATPSSCLPVVAAFDPCCMTVALSETKSGKICLSAVDQILRCAFGYDVIAFGPGIGTSTGLQTIVDTLISQKDLRIVIDADGLNNLSRNTGWVERKRASVVLTPHPGEMKRLWSSLMRQDLPKDRTEQAVALSQRTDCVVALKGAGTVVTDSEKVYLNTTGNPGMSTAGSGDVLTGVIAALMGQELCDFDAAVLGVYLHGLAGDLATEPKGRISLIATDIVEALPNAFIYRCGR